MPQDLTDDAKRAIETYLWQRGWTILKYSAPFVSILAGLVSWAVAVVSKSVTEAAVAKTVAALGTEVERFEHDFDLTRTAFHEDTAEFNRELGRAEGKLERLEPAIRDTEQKLSKAKSLLQASDDVSKISQALADDDAFVDLVRKGFLDVPIGAIVAWHETPKGVTIDKSHVGPGKRWMRCNGQLVTDTESVFDGHELPDLNGKGRFLRGGPTSGRKEEASQISEHLTAANDRTFLSIAVDPVDGTRPSVKERWSTRDYSGQADTLLELSQGQKVRPINMSVVWIIRVK